MKNLVKSKMIEGLTKMANEPPKHYSTGMRHSKGILINRDPPLGTGWCGSDNCEHKNHKDMRRAQAAADTKANK